MNTNPASDHGLDTTTETSHEHCIACVFFPPNLPASAYSEDDYSMLQEKSCCFDHRPGGSDCSQTRKTSCSLLDLEQVGSTPRTEETES